MNVDARAYLSLARPLALLLGVLLLVGCAVAPPRPEFQDRIRLKGGGELSGDLLRIDAETLLFAHDTLGLKTIQLSEVEEISADGVSLITADGEELVVTVLRRGEHWIEVRVGDEMRWLELASLRKDPLRLRWDADLTFGTMFASGNTNERGTQATLRLVGQAEGERVTGEVDWAYAEDLGATADEWRVSRRRFRTALQYDYTALQEGFLWANSSALNDAFADIDLQWITGVGAGYELFTGDRFKLSASAGLAYVKRDFREGEDREYPAGRAAMSLAWKPVGDVELAQDASMVPSLTADEIHDIIVRVDTRLRWDMVAQLFTQLRWTLDHDSAPSEGSERTDQSLALQLGLSF